MSLEVKLNYINKMIIENVSKEVIKNFINIQIENEYLKEKLLNNLK